MSNYKNKILCVCLLIIASHFTYAENRNIIQFHGMITTPTCQLAAVTTLSTTPLPCPESTSTQDLDIKSVNSQQIKSSSVTYHTQYLLAEASHKGLKHTPRHETVIVTYD